MEIRNLLITLMVISVTIPISAAQITVDGDDSDWIALEGTPLEAFKYDVDDPTRELTWETYSIDYPSGFDLERGSIYIDVISDYPNVSLYFKIVTNGTIGDATGDGDAKNGTRNIYSGSSEIIYEGGPYNTGGNPLSGSQYDMGEDELYQIMFDYNNDGFKDETIKFGDTNQLLWDSTSDSTGLIASYSGRVLEIGAINVGNHDSRLANLLFRYDMYSGSQQDYWSEDYLPRLTPSPPVADFTGIPSCQGSAEFTSTSNGNSPIVWFEWYFGDGNTDFGFNATTSHQYATGGTYTVTLNVTNLWGLSNQTSKQITVGEGPVTVDAGDDKTIGIGDCVVIGNNPTASGGETPYTYLWTPSTGLNATNVPNPLACPTTTTTYTVSVKDNNNYLDKESCWNSDQVQVRVLRPGISLSKSCPPSPVHVGDVLTYEYTVRNTGDVPLTNVQLTDDKTGLPAFIGGDTNVNGWLDLTEIWRYEATYTVLSEETITNIAVVTAQDEVGNQVTDTDKCVVPYKVPTLSTIGLIILSGLLGFIAIFRILEKE